MAEGGKNDAAYIASNLISVIKQVDAEDGVQVELTRQHVP
jgi:hypothetical protein